MGFFLALSACSISVEEVEAFQHTTLGEGGELDHASVYLSSSHYLSMLLLLEFEGNFQVFRKNG